MVSENLGKLPPQAVDLEEAVLSCCFFENVIFDVKSILKKECFYKDCHQKIFEAMEQLCENMTIIDIFTLGEQLRKNDFLDEIGGPFFIAKLSGIVSSPNNALEYSKIIYQKYVSRELIRIFSEGTAKSFDDELNDPSDIIESVNNSIVSLIDLRGNSVIKVKKVIDDVYANIDKNQLTKEDITGIRSGLIKLDRHTNGFQKTDLIIIAGETSQGKTSLALNIARNGSYRNFKCAFYSLEMSSLQLGARLLSQESGISSKRILMEKLGINEMQQIDERMKKLYNSEIYIDEKVTTKFSDILNSIRLMKLKLNIDFVILDYIQLVKNGIKGKSTSDEIGDVANTLKRCARDLNICIVALSQMSRDQNPIPSLRRLKQSGDIENAADTVIFTYRPESYQNANWFNSMEYEGLQMEGKAQIIVAKGRNIGTTDFICNFHAPTTLFYDLQTDLNF